MSNPFFAGIEQRDAAMVGIEGKTPCFYRDGRMVSMMFPVRIDRIKQRLPDTRFRPVQVAPGIGVLHLSAFEYRDVDIRPYNEFAVGILLASPEFANVPGYNLAKQVLHRRLHTYVLHLPVNTELARSAGVDLYNYPKILASIDFSRERTESMSERGTSVPAEGEMISCRIATEHAPIATLTGRQIPTRRSGIFSYICHTYQDQQPQSVEFKINAHAYGLARGWTNGTADFHGGRHPIAAEVRDLILTPRPLGYLYVPSFEAILFGPERLTLSLAGRFIADSLAHAGDGCRMDAQ